VGIKFTVHVRTIYLPEKGVRGGSICPYRIYCCYKLNDKIGTQQGSFRKRSETRCIVIPSAFGLL
jgi:hypothetical protein